MKKFGKALLVLAALIIVIVVAVTYFPEAFTSPGDSTNTSGGTNPSEPPISDNLARPADATLSHVAYVHDGDTLFLQPDGTYARDDQIKVRLIGIDSPELRPEVECFGVEARDYLRGMLPEGTEVWIKTDREALDQYGRRLLYLWTMDDRSVNLDLVERGYATALNIAPSNTFWKTFDAAESAARTADAGLWGAC
ncbi:MAG: thermonuclease family protein [Microbacteriaceae bacterium]|nr:thermonuclease family protein [Microbacteriaceae bacterium]